MTIEIPAEFVNKVFAQVGPAKRRFTMTDKSRLCRLCAEYKLTLTALANTLATKWEDEDGKKLDESKLATALKTAMDVARKVYKDDGFAKEEILKVFPEVKLSNSSTPGKRGRSRESFADLMKEIADL